MVIPGWVAVVVFLTSSQPNIHVDHFKVPFATEQDCKNFNIEAEKQLINDADERIIAWGFSCAEVTVDDHDTSDDPKSKAIPRTVDGPKKK
jgi:hypothetical protein